MHFEFTVESVLSHELKAPLNAIEGYLKMVKDREMGNNLADYDTMIDRSLDRVKGMRHLILDLLDLTRVELGKSNRDITSVDLQLMAKTAMDTMRPYSIQRDIALNLFCDKSITINGDAEELEIIFNNLISNAIKYNKEGGKVDISINQVAECIEIKVVDSGIGMSASEIEKIFDDFVRIKTEKTKHIAGSGLGLSIVKKLIDNYGGKIEVSSIPDKGSTFIIRIPIEKPCS